MASTTPKTHPFTCNSCQVAFKSSELQRTHMQTDWHRYNLKRRMASLPPLASEIFNEKVLASQADAAATAARTMFQQHCEPCQKTYYSENAYNNHLGSKRHRLNAVKSDHKENKQDAEVRSVMSSTFSLGDNTHAKKEEAVDEEAEEEFNEIIDGMKKTDIDDQEDPITRRPTRPHHSAADERSLDQSLPMGVDKETALTRCLFCSKESKDLLDNQEHMKVEHSLFVPEQRYLIDVEGLITYLYGKVHVDFQCLYCNRLKFSENSVKDHMIDAGHCKIAYETEDEQLELGQFYDFRSTYSDGNYDDSDDHTADEDEEGWETSSDASSVPSEELGKVYEDPDKSELRERLRRHKHHSKSNVTRHKSADGYHSHAHFPVNAVYHDDFEIHLPSGRVAGHRAHNRYYKQNLRSYSTPYERAQRLITEGDMEVDEEGDATPRGRQGRPMRDTNRQLVSRSNGGLGMLAVSESKKREVRALEKKERTRAHREHAKWQWKTDRTANNQKHFRDPLLQ